MKNEPASPICSACRDDAAQPFPFTMAFQPIVDVAAGQVFADEALVRGIERRQCRLNPEPGNDMKIAMLSIKTVG